MTNKLIEAAGKIASIVDDHCIPNAEMDGDKFLVDMLTEALTAYQTARDGWKDVSLNFVEVEPDGPDDLYLTRDIPKVAAVQTNETIIEDGVATPANTAREGAGEVEVRELVWSYFEVRGHFDEIGVWDANSILGTFTIEKHGVGEFCLKPPKGGLRKPKRNLEEVKADAMLVLTAEIRSALAGG